MRIVETGHHDLLMAIDHSCVGPRRLPDFRVGSDSHDAIARYGYRFCIWTAQVHCVDRSIKDNYVCRKSQIVLACRRVDEHGGGDDNNKEDEFSFHAGLESSLSDAHVAKQLRPNFSSL